MIHRWKRDRVDPKVIEQDRKETEATRELRLYVESQTGEIEELSQKLIEINKRNHFGEGIVAAIMGGKRHAT